MDRAWLWTSSFFFLLGLYFVFDRLFNFAVDDAYAVIAAGLFAIVYAWRAPSVAGPRR